jgi:hypothetical protein
VANLPKLLAQLRDAAHRLGLPPPSARSGETLGNRAPLYQWDTFAHRFVGSLPHSPAWSLFDNAGGLGCGCYLRRLYWRSQFHLQSAVVGGGAPAAQCTSQGLASPHEHAPVLSWFPVLRGRGGNRLLEPRRNPRHLWHVVGRVDHHGTYALSRVVASIGTALTTLQKGAFIGHSTRSLRTHAPPGPKPYPLPNRL